MSTYSRSLLRVLLKSVLVGFILINVSFQVFSQHIVISDSLAANSEQLQLKMGVAGIGRMYKYRFGNYGLISSREGWTTINSKTNFWGTKVESSSDQKFSFVFGNKTTDTAFVNASTKTKIKELQEIQVNEHFSLGDYALLESTDWLSAMISLKSNADESWLLLMNASKGLKAPNFNEGVLSNGSRKIIVRAITSNENGTDKRMFPAKGYELFENGRSLGAVQYFGGGSFGMNKGIVWLSKNNDASTNLMLGAAMTAIYHFKFSTLANDEWN
ncbi:hypothetical protein [Solitalea longa]|nr:hypothetical protein [Solitalea longa]